MQLGRSAFHKKVKELTGHTPADYLLEARMQHAANKLLTTELSVAEIAYLSGFRKPSYFNQKFKERFQCTPLHNIEKVNHLYRRLMQMMIVIDMERLQVYDATACCLFGLLLLFFRSAVVNDLS